MADNVETASGSGGVTVAADDISSVFYPRVKISWGVDGSASDASATDPFPVYNVPNAASQTIYRNIDVDESEDEVSGSAVTVLWMIVFNMANAPRFLKLYNAAAANVTVGSTTPDLTFPIPSPGDTNGAGFNVPIPPDGIPFSTALSIAATTAVGDADTGAPGANEVIVNLGYA